MQLPLIEIRDKRQKEWFWADNEFFNGTAKIVGSAATLVYFALCRHSSNEEQSCYPSMETLAEETGLTRKTVSKGIETLEHNGIIQIEERYDVTTKKRENNIYYLLNRKYWKTLTPGAFSVASKEETASHPEAAAKAGTEIKTHEKTDHYKVELPEGINREAWDAWCRYRKEIKKRMTPMTVKQQLRFLSQNIPDHLEIIRNSIRNGWTGLFPLKKDKPKTFNKPMSFEERDRRTRIEDDARAHRKRMEWEAEKRERSEAEKNNDMLRQIREMTQQLSGQFTMK